MLMDEREIVKTIDPAIQKKIQEEKEKRGRGWNERKQLEIIEDEPTDKSQDGGEEPDEKSPDLKTVIKF